MKKRFHVAKSAPASDAYTLPLAVRRSLAIAFVLALVSFFLCGAGEWGRAATSAPDAPVIAQIRKWTAPPPVNNLKQVSISSSANSAYSDIADFCDDGYSDTSMRCVSINGGTSLATACSSDGG